MSCFTKSSIVWVYPLLYNWCDKCLFTTNARDWFSNTLTWTTALLYGSLQGLCNLVEVLKAHALTKHDECANCRAKEQLILLWCVCILPGMTGIWISMRLVWVFYSIQKLIMVRIRFIICQMFLRSVFLIPKSLILSGLFYSTAEERPIHNFCFLICLMLP